MINILVLSKYPIINGSTNSEVDWIQLPNERQRKEELHNVFFVICTKLPKETLVGD